MELGNFSTVFEIASALNIAYVAVEYSTSYTLAVAKNFFKFNRFVDEQIDSCKKYIDQETINTLKDTQVGKVNTKNKIVSTQRKSEILIKRLREERNSLLHYIKTECQTKLFPPLCLYMFLYCVVASFGMAYGSSQYIGCCWVAFFLISVLYTFAGFIWGEKKQYKKWISAYSLKGCCIGFLGALFLAFIGGVIGQRWLLDINKEVARVIWNIVIPVSAFFPYVYFVLFIFELGKKSKKIKKEITQRTEAIEPECAQIKDDVDWILKTHEYSLSPTDNPGTDLVPYTGKKSASPLIAKKQNEGTNKNKTKDMYNNSRPPKSNHKH